MYQQKSSANTAAACQDIAARYAKKTPTLVRGLLRSTRTSRLRDVHPRPILNLLTLAGEKCDRLMADRIKGIHVREVQCDEMWSFVGMKEKTKHRKGDDSREIGDAYTFVAIERYSKLVLAWHLGSRTEADTIAFTEKLAYATEGNFQTTADGFKPYQHAIVLSLGAQYVDFARLVKMYSAVQEKETRYSPAECIGCRKVAIYSQPDMEKVSTARRAAESHDENAMRDLPG